MKLTSEQHDMIKRLRSLDAAAKKGPWYQGGKPSKNGRVYTMKQPEEDLVIAMRNALPELLDIIEKSTQ